MTNQELLDKWYELNDSMESDGYVNFEGKGMITIDDTLPIDDLQKIIDFYKEHPEFTFDMPGTTPRRAK